jgi:prepilin signal peptidase PulO-like enzyme (type II secretory pathway)
MVAGYAVVKIIYGCKLSVLPVRGVILASVTAFGPGARWCEPPIIASFPIMIAPWLVATYLLARREAIVPSFGRDGSGIIMGWFACVFMGLMWWLGFLAFDVLWFQDTISELLRFAVVGGAIAVPVIGFLTALVGSAIQVFIRWRRRKRLPQAA